MTELKTEDEALQVLMDADIDKVMAGLDRIIDAAPSYEKLFMRWQRQHWTTEDFDFTEDARQWADPDFFTEEERRFITVRLLAVLPRRGPGDRRADPVRARGADQRGRSSSSRPRSPTRRSTLSSGIASIARCSARPADGSATCSTSTARS